VGDFAADTAVMAVGDGSYTATLSQDWEIWGPAGGYVLAVALRAAGAHSRFDRPANVSCHFLGTASFGPVDLAVETQRGGKRAESLRVSMTQDGRPICTAMTWVVSGDTEGYEHDWTERPDVPAPLDVPTAEERFAQLPDPVEPPVTYPVWQNIEYRPLEWSPPEEWMSRTEPLPPEWKCWLRYRPTAAFDDPFVEAARVAFFFDIMGWPALQPAVPAAEFGTWMAPNIDTTVWFHHPPAGSEFLCLEAVTPVAVSGVIGSSGSVWSEDGRLLATGSEHLLYRAVAAPAPGGEGEHG
jgi:acyl-CoA thioesterase II